MSNLQPGITLGAYRIICQIGQGGMATVYKAYHPAMDRYVAIKVLPPLFARGDEFHGRFQQEARTIGRLERTQPRRNAWGGRIIGDTRHTERSRAARWCWSCGEARASCI